MNHAAVRPLAPAANNDAPMSGFGVPTLPWETDADAGAARQETWLLSFIDILALLLTLFVLLLAYQGRDNAQSGASTGGTGEPTPAIFDLLLIPGSSAEVQMPEGFAMPGNGLVPIETPPAQVTAPNTDDVAVADESPASTVPLQASEVAEAPVNVATTQTAPATSAPPAERNTVESAQAQTVGPTAAQAVAPADERLAVDTDSAAAPAEVQRATAVAESTEGTAPAHPVNGDPGKGSAVVEAEMPASPSAADEVTDPVSASPAQQAAEALMIRLHDTDLGDRVDVVARPGAVSLEISDSILFPPASATLSENGQALLDQLAAILGTLPYSMSVEGHTDNVPIHTRVYPSNWELSSARAAMVTRKLIAQGVAAERLRAVGYGDTRPRGDNGTAEGRADNRRVTFVLQVEDPR